MIRMFGKKDRRFGWIKDKYDPRDYYYKAVKPRVIPESVDLSAFLPAIRDQGNEGSCVGFGVGINLTATAKQQNAFKEWFGPRWIYNGARELEHRLDQEGAEPRDAFEFILKYGCLLEQFWPYVAKKEWYKPASTHENASKAKDWPIIEYVRVVDGKDGLCQALADGHLVSIGMPWYYEWMNPKADGILGTPINVAGGHEVCIYGYDTKTQLFKIANSWTVDWGDKGRCYMNFAYLAKLKADGGYDAHIVTVKWGTTNGGPEDYPVAEIESVQCFDRLEGMDTWRELGPPNEIPDGQLPIYRFRTTINTTGNFEAFARTKLKDGRTFDGPIRKFKVIEVNPPPPPPPPPPEKEPSAVIEVPTEGEEVEAGKEKIWEIHVYKKA
jgi:hypothetical protein